jgi:Asparagine synthase
VDGCSPVPREEIDALILAYSDVRGPEAVTVKSVGHHGYCAKLGDDVSGAIERDDASWCVTVGKVHASGALSLASPEEIDGQFAAVRHDEATGELQVFNDAFGMQTMYVSVRDGRLFASTSASALARHLRAAPDPLGAAVFLRTGVQVGPVSLWKEIRRLDPATRLTVSSSGLSEATYWKPTVDERVRGMSFAETVEHCCEVILSTIESRLAHEPCMLADLTGGFDSRLVTAALARLGIGFTAKTSGETETVDVRLAREVARAGGFTWHQEALPGNWTPDDEALRRALGWGDGRLDVLPLAAVLWRLRLRSRSCGLVVTGGGGEHFGPHAWMHQFLRAGRSRHINMDNFMSMRVLLPIDVSMLRADPTPTAEAYSRDVLARRAALYADQLNTTQLDAVDAYRAAPHFGAYRSAAEAHVRSEMPCYYRDIFTAAFSSHHRFRNRHRLHRGIIDRINPAMGAVETARGGPAQRVRLGNAHRFAPYYLRLARTAARKVQGRRAPLAPEGVAQAGYRQAVQRLRRGGFFAPETMRSGGLYDPDALAAVLDRAGRPEFDGWPMVGRIVTLELALQSVDGASLSTLAG